MTIFLRDRKAMISGGSPASVDYYETRTCCTKTCICLRQKYSWSSGINEQGAGWHALATATDAGVLRARYKLKIRFKIKLPKKSMTWIESDRLGWHFCKMINHFCFSIYGCNIMPVTLYRSSGDYAEEGTGSSIGTAQAPRPKWSARQTFSFLCLGSITNRITPLALHPSQ